jgi:RNA-directed DNA polymerase
LGLCITPNGHITVDKKMKKNLETLFHFYLTDKFKYQDFLNKNYKPRNNKSTEYDKVSGVLTYIKPIDKEFISKLKRKYGNYLINSFMDRSINE